MVRYWEASLPASHIPSDSKMENFIRTKYSSKRWILSPAPPADPAILDEIPENVNDESQDSVPLAIVKQSLRHDQQQRQVAQPNLLEIDTPPRRTPDLPPLRTESASPNLPARDRKDRVSNQSLLGFDIDSPVRTQSAPQFPSTTTSTPVRVAPASRNELKNSILRLYAPKPVTAPSTPPVAPVATPPVSQSALGDLNSAFSSLSTKSTPLTSTSITTSSAFSGFSSGGLSFGQTSNQQPTKPVPVQQPTSFTIPIKKTSSGIAPTTTPPIPITNKSSLPPPISTPQISTSTKTSSNTIPPSLGTTSSKTFLPTSNYAPTFNLSKSSAPPPQVNPSTTAPPAQKPIQLLSSLTHTTSTSAATTSLSSTPSQNISSSFANPWATTSAPAPAVTNTTPTNPWASPTSNNNGFGGTSSNAFGTNSGSAFGGFGGNSASTLGDAFTSSSSSQNTNAAIGTGSSNSFSATSLSDAFSSQNPSTAKGTNSNSFGTTSLGDSFPSRPAANSSHSNSFSVTSFGEAFSSSSQGMGDDSWGGSTTENTAANGSGTDKKFDDFGLFETADVWK